MAANRALLIGWNRVVAGREATASELFGQLIGYFTKQQEAGKIESFEPVFLGAHGGDLNGFVLARGNQGNLDAISNDDNFLNLVIAGNYNLVGFGVVRAFVGEGVQDIMARWQKNIVS